LAHAAVDAVKWWRFQPYELNGQPAEVRTTIEVDFRLN
jgi:protein TonB